jgi:hypothetical protein
MNERIDLPTPLGLNIFPAAETHGEFGRGAVAMGNEESHRRRISNDSEVSVMCGYAFGRSSRSGGVTASRISFGRGACRNKGDSGVCLSRSNCKRVCSALTAKGDQLSVKDGIAAGVGLDRRRAEIVQVCRGFWVFEEGKELRRNRIEVTRNSTAAAYRTVVLCVCEGLL